MKVKKESHGWFCYLIFFELSVVASQDQPLTSPSPERGSASLPAVLPPYLARLWPPGEGGGGDAHPSVLPAALLPVLPSVLPAEIVVHPSAAPPGEPGWGGNTQGRQEKKSKMSQVCNHGCSICCLL